MFLQYPAVMIFNWLSIQSLKVCLYKDFRGPPPTCITIKHVGNILRMHECLGCSHRKTVSNLPKLSLKSCIMKKNPLTYVNVCVGVSSFKTFHKTIFAFFKAKKPSNSAVNDNMCTLHLHTVLSPFTLLISFKSIQCDE